MEVLAASDEASARQAAADESSVVVQKKAKALYEYISEAPNELTIKPGDIIWIIDDSPLEQWWEGYIEGRGRGFFPAQYCEILPDDGTRIAKKDKIQRSARKAKYASKKKKHSDTNSTESTTETKKDKKSKKDKVKRRKSGASVSEKIRTDASENAAQRESQKQNAATEANAKALAHAENEIASLKQKLEEAIASLATEREQRQLLEKELQETKSACEELRNKGKGVTHSDSNLFI